MRAPLLLAIIGTAGGFRVACPPRAPRATLLRAEPPERDAREPPQPNAPPSHEPRRGALRWLAASGAAGCAAADAAEPREGVLVWRAQDRATSCAPGKASRVFGKRFVNYLSRFLLAYDGPSRRLWRQRSEEIPLRWTAGQVAKKREEQFGEFLLSVEAGLCGYAPPSDDAGRVDWAAPTARAKVRQLFSLLRSRYGDRPDAKRQIALLFCLLAPEAQPTRSIAEIVAKAEDRAVASVLVLEGGIIVDGSRENAAPALEGPALPPPFAGKNATAVAGAPRLEPTGAVGKVVVTFPGAYDRGAPAVTVSPPGDPDGRPAQAVAVVRNGFCGDVVVVDGGAGYDRSDRIEVTIEAPRGGGAPSEAFAALAYGVAAVPVLKGGAGFGSSMDLEDVAFAPAGASEILAPPRATLVLGDGAATDRRTRGFRRPSFQLPVEVGAGPPSPPSTTRDASLVGPLLSLLPPDLGAPTYDRYADPPRHRFPYAKYATLEEVEKKAVPFFGAFERERGIDALPTAVTGGVRRDLPLTPDLALRLALAGGACAATTRALTSPLDRRKTRAQASLGGDDDDWAGVDASAVAGFTLGAGSFGTYEALRACSRAPPRRRWRRPALRFGADPAGGVRARAAEGGLWSGAPALFGRELPFTVAKFAVYASAQSFLLALVPAARERPLVGLGVSLSRGRARGLAGACARRSRADTVMTRLAVAGEGETVRDAVDAVLRGADGPGAMAKALWAGLPQRCLAMAVLVAAQFLLFDSMRAVLAVSPKDLSVVLDVFQDRISYYEGWDEIAQQWEEAISELGDLVS
ncbi:phosphate ion transmembrane transporter [Aureococcus anophagefferens]|uniref:Phosphate ion transmembrane transporter n=1 Tax=Aureococcus anophagefferens TaxID=44056 RepID=A0ABR1FQ17_AURAN